MKTKDSIGLRAYGGSTTLKITDKDTSVYVDATNANAIDATDGGYYSDWSNITLISHGGYAVSAAQVQIASATYFCARGERGAINASSVSVPSSNVFLVSENFDGSNPSAKYDKTKVSTYKFVQTSKNQISWLRFTEPQKSVYYLACINDGEFDTITAVAPKEYAGTITYKSSNTSIATVDSNTGKVTINSKGKTGTVRITASGTADSNISAKAMTASYDLTVTGTADFTYQPIRAAQLLAANGGTATWDVKSKTLTLNGINYTAARITDLEFISTKSAIYLQPGTTVVLEGNNKIRLADGEENAAVGIGSEGGITFKGSGTLDIAGDMVCAVQTTGGGLDFQGGKYIFNTVNIHADLDDYAAVYAAGNITIDSSVEMQITHTSASSKASGIYAGGTFENNGTLTINVQLKEGSGIHAKGNISFTGGKDVNITFSSNEASTEICGIYGEGATIQNVNANITLNGSAANGAHIRGIVGASGTNFINSGGSLTIELTGKNAEYGIGTDTTNLIGGKVSVRCEGGTPVPTGMTIADGQVARVGKAFNPTEREDYSVYTDDNAAEYKLFSFSASGLKENKITFEKVVNDFKINEYDIDNKPTFKAVATNTETEIKYTPIEGGTSFSDDWIVGSYISVGSNGEAFIYLSGYHNVGKVTIEATQAESDEYEAASATFSFNVLPETDFTKDPGCAQSCLSNNWDGGFSYNKNTNTLTVSDINYDGNFPLIGDNMTVVVKGDCKINTSADVALEGVTAIRGENDEASLTLSAGNNAVHLGNGGTKLTLQNIKLDASTKNGAVLCVDGDDSTVETVYSDITLSGGSIVNDKINAISYNSDYITAVASTTADGNSADAYDNSKIHTYKYFKATRASGNAIWFETKKESIGYCDETFQSKLSKASEYNGTITYESSDTTIATVDSDGLVTINSDAKTGPVIITANAAASEDFGASTASYELEVENTADWTKSTSILPERPRQLLMLKGGDARGVRGVSSRPLLQVSGITYEGNIIIWDDSSYFGAGLRAYRPSDATEGKDYTSTLGSASKTITIGGSGKDIGLICDGADLIINSYIDTCSTGTGGKIMLVGDTDRGGDIYLNGGLHASEIDMTGELARRVPNVTIANISKENFNFEKDGKFSIKKGTLTMTGELEAFFGNLGTIERKDNIWMEVSTDIDGKNPTPISGVEDIDSSKLSTYKYFKASDQKVSDWLSFSKDKVAVSYSANEASAVTPDIPTDYTAAGGTVTYTSSAPEIAAVDENTGAVTLNTEGKTGTVTITATAGGTTKYNEATASCELTVLPIADFTANGERAAQILGANTETAAWDNDTKTLTITGISYEAEGAEFADISEDAGIDTANAVILPDGAIVAVSGANTVKGSSFESIVKFVGSGTISGDGTLSVTGLANADGASPDNAICIGDGGKLTIDGKAFVNTEGARYGFYGDPSGKLHVNTGGIYAKGNDRAINPSVDFSYDEHVQITAAAGLDDQLGEYSEGGLYRQIRAKYVADNEITFTNDQGNVDYCSTSSVTNPATGLGTGKITYEVTEGADIVDVDDTGKVTINKGRFGKVTITATQAADEDYAEASAGYSFYIRGTADFDANSTRALQLLNTNGGGGTATLDSDGLTLENISYAVEGGVAVKYTTGNIIVKGINSITSPNNIALELARYHENAGKTIKGSGSGTDKLTLNTGGNTALDLSGVLTITDGVTVEANGKGKYTVSGNGSWGGIVIKNANLVITSATNDGKGGIVNSSCVPYIRYDVDEIKRMGGNSQASAKVDNSYTYWYAWHYFSATVKNTITASEAYELSTTEKPLDAAGVTVSGTDINKLDTSYDGDLANATLQYKNTASEDDTMLEKITAAGTYEVWLSMPTTDEYQPIAAASIGTLTVNKGTVNAAELFNAGDQTKVYDGEIKSYDLPEDLGCYDGSPTITYENGNGDEILSVRNVGRYDVYATAKETANFEAIAKTKIGTLTITGKEVPAADIFDEFSKTEIYDGKAKTVAADELTKKDEAYNGTVTISYKQGEEAVEAPTDAGTYDVYVSADAAGNYAAIAPTKIGTLTIDKKQLDSATDAFTFAGEGGKQTVKYDGEVQKAEITKKDIVGYEDGLAKITYKQGETVVENPTELGTYTVYVSADESKNYKAISETEMGTLEIVQGDGSLAFEKQIADFEYCNAEKATFTNPATGNGGKVTYKVTKGTDIADVNAETGEVTVNKGHFGAVEITATQEATDNYAAATASYSFNVGGKADFTLDKDRACQLLITNGGEKANAKIREANGWLELNNITYNQPVKYGGDVLVVYNEVNITVDSGIAFESTYNTGNFKIRATGTLNLTTKDSSKAALKVRKNLVLEGDVSGPVNVNTVGGILSSNGNATITITDDASLHYANFTATGAEGESWIKNSSIKTVKFNDKVIKAVVGDSSSDENMTIYTGSDEDLAKHYFSATIKNAAPAADAFTVTDNEATYDGNEHKATIAVAEDSDYDGDLANATIKYKDESGNKLDAATNAGTYTILLTMPATDNYQAINELNIGTFTIAKGKSSLAFASDKISDVYYCQNIIKENQLTTDSTGTITYEVTEGSEIADVNTETGAVTIDQGHFGDVVITATQEADGNYEEASASYSFKVIGQADFERDAERALQLLRTNGGENCTAEWDAATKTLTIENLNYASNGYSAILVKRDDKATLVVKGENTVESAGAVALNLFSTVRGEGDGAKLTLVGDASICVNSSDELNIQNITLIADGRKNGVYAYDKATVKIENANVTISGAEHALYAKDNLPVTLSYDSSMIKAVASAEADGSNPAAYDSSKSSTYKYIHATVKNAAPDADIFSVSENTATYDGQPHKAKVTFAKGTQYDGDLANATIKYEDKNGNKLDAATNAGEYQVLLSMPATAEYQAIDGLNVGTLTIAKATATADEAFSYEDETLGYDGTAKTADVTVKELKGGITLTPVITYKQGETVIDAPTKAGTYDVYVEAAESDNYNAVVSAKVGTLTITQAAATDFEVTGELNPTYDGEAKTVTVTATDSKYDGKLTVTYKQGDEVVDAPTNAGTYDIWVSADATDNYGAVNTKLNEKLVIAKATATADEAFSYEDESFGYDGTAKAATVTSKELKGGITLTPVITYKKGGVEVADPTEAGEYEVWAEAAESDNYNAVVSAKIGTLTITQAAATGFEVTGNLNPIYDGEAKTVTVKATDSKYDGKLTVTYKQGDEVVDAPTNAGTYDIWVSADATDNYGAVNTKLNEKLEIAKATASAKDAFTYEDETLAYTGNPVSATKIGNTNLVGFDYSKRTVTYKQGETVVTEPTEKGTYDVYVGADESENYNAVEPMKLGTLTIKASDVEAANIFERVNETATYDGKEHKATLTLKDTEYTGLAEAVISYADSKGDAVDAPVNAGTYTVYVEAPESGKYAAIIKTAIGTVTIEPAKAIAAEIFNEVMITAIYDGTAHGAALTSQNELYDGKWTVSYYKVKDENETQVEGEPVNAGTYNVHVSAAATNNYEAMADTVIGTVTIAKATATADEAFAYENQTFTYNGEAKTATVTAKALINGFEETPVITYKKGGVEVAEPTDAGEYEVWVGAVETENYNAVESAMIGTLTISAGELSFTIEEGTNKATYDGNAHKATVKATASKYDGKLTVTYKQGETVVEEPTNAGTYDIYVSAEATTNFAEVTETKIGELVIAKAAINADNAFSYTDTVVAYNGEEQTAKVSAKDIPGFVDGSDKMFIKYKKSGEENFLEGNPKEIGTYEVWVGADETDNYKAIDAMKLGTLEITSKTADATQIFKPVDTKVTYTGEPQSAVLEKVEGSDYDGEPQLSYTTVDGTDVPEPTNAGTYKVFVTANATATYDAIARTEIGTLTIEKATLNPVDIFGEVNAKNEGETELAVSAAYDGNVHKINMPTNEKYKDLPWVITYQDQQGQNVDEPTEAGTYSIVVNATGMENYEDLTDINIGTLTIVQEAVDITGTFVSWDKDENAEIKLYDTTGENALTDAQIRDDMRNNNGAKAIADYSGICEAPVAGDKSGQYKQNFTISGVKNGTYKLAIFKAKRNGTDPYVVTVMDVTVTDTALKIEEDINMWLYGDVNYDGRINPSDVAQVLRKASRRDSVIDENNTHQCIAADVNGDNKINPSDVAQILRKASRRDSALDKYLR